MKNLPPISVRSPGPAVESLKALPRHLLPALIILFPVTAQSTPASRPPGPLSSQAFQASPQATPADEAELLALRSAGQWSELAAVLKERLAAFLLAPSLRGQWTLELAEALAQLGRHEEAVLLLGELSRDVRVKAVDRAVAQRRAVALSRLFSTAGAAESYQRALVHFQAGRLVEARQILQRLLTDEPSQLDSLVRLGQLCLLQADWDSGVEHLRRARMLNPFEPVISLWLGKALLERGELDEARRELQRASEAMETREQAYEWLIDLEARGGNPKGAARWVGVAVNRYPASPTIWGAVLRSNVLIEPRQWRQVRRVLLEKGDERHSERHFDQSGGLGCSWKTRRESLADLRLQVAERDSVSR